jgi:hypothetical protein
MLVCEGTCEFTTSEGALGEKFGRRQAGTEAICMQVALDAWICEIGDGARRGRRMADEGQRWCCCTAALARDPSFHTCLTVMQESPSFGSEESYQG